MFNTLIWALDQLTEPNPVRYCPTFVGHPRPASVGREATVKRTKVGITERFKLSENCNTIYDFFQMFAGQAR